MLFRSYKSEVHNPLPVQRPYAQPFCGQWLPCTFTGCESLASITIPDSVTSIGINPFGCCKKLIDIRVSSNHPYLEVVDGVLFSKPDKRLVCYPCALTATEYTIPHGIQMIEDYALYYCSSLKAVTIPDSVTDISEYAFSGCESLTSVTIPDSVTDIRWCAFYGCVSLTSVTIPDSVTSIGDDTRSEEPHV